MPRQRSSKRQGVADSGKRSAVEALEARRLFAVITVNTTSDADMHDSVLSLREAIKLVDGTLSVSSLSVDEAAQVVGAVGVNDAIQFALPGSGVQTISPTTDLPAVTHEVVIDGYSQPGSARATDNTPANDLVRLDGASDTTPAASGLRIESPSTHVVGLVIDNFSGAGIFLTDGSSDTVLEGNYLGITADGLGAEGNGAGVFVKNASGFLIGSEGAADRNIISGNTQGIVLENVVPEDSDNGSPSFITGNYIGVDPSGAVDVENEQNGIEIRNRSNVTIGGLTSNERNVISDNGADGIKIDVSGSGDSAQNIAVEGNYIGTDSSGTIAIGNGANGIEVVGATEGSAPETLLTIGGTAAGAGNVISGNEQNGIFQHVGNAGSSIIQGNIIGLSAAGTAVLPNFDGIFLQQSDENTIGGAVAGAGNLISGNLQDGVDIDSSIDNNIQGNRIGVLADGVTPAGNQVDGVSIEYNASFDVVGGSAAEDGNLIANSGRDGVEISSLNTAVPFDDAIRFNSIFSNARLGIDLDTAGDLTGVTPNDPMDADEGSNGLPNFPVISSATATASTVTVSGSIETNSGQYYDLDFYASDVADPSGYGEGKQYIGSVNVYSDGHASFNSTFNVAIGSNLFISATSTELNDTELEGTSEFAQTVKATVTGPTGPTNPTSPLPSSSAPALATAKSTLASLQAQSHSAALTKPQAALVKKQLAAITHQLNSIAALVKKQATFAAQYNKETGLIAALQAQLAATSSTSAKAKIQKKINVDTAAQSKALNQDNAVSSSATASLSTVTTAENAVQSELTDPLG